MQEIFLGVKAHVISLTEEPPSIGFGHGSRVLERLIDMRHYRSHQDAPAIDLENSEQLVQGLIVIGHML